MRISLSSLTGIINPAPVIGGLELSDSFLRYVRLTSIGGIKNMVLRLPPGIVVGGQVRDEKKLVQALHQLRVQINGKYSSVIVTIPANTVFAQIFTLPYLALEKIEEAALLNLKIISPLDIATVYSDWEFISAGKGVESQLELLGAFLRMDIAQRFLRVLQQAGFIVVALEFAPLSLARAVKKMMTALDPIKPYLILAAGNEGIDFIIFKSGAMYFNHFLPWPSADLKNICATEMQKILNFYYGRWGTTIADVIFLHATDLPDITAVLSDLKLTVVPLPKTTLPVSLWGALGAAIRGLIPRSQDRLISLASVGTEDAYYRNRILYFIRGWRVIFTTVFGILLVASGLAYFFLNSIDSGLTAGLALIPTHASDLTNLEEKAKIFNTLVTQALAARQQSPAWTPLFNQLTQAAGLSVTITRIFYDPTTATVLFDGMSSSDVEVINLKNRLTKNPLFESVSLPLSQIGRQGDKVLFQMTLKVKAKN